MNALLRLRGSLLRRWRSHPWETLGMGVLAVGLLAACPVAVYRAAFDTGGTDYPNFHATARHLLDHGEIQPNSFARYYWPSITVAWAGLAWMPIPIGAALWYAVGCLCWIGLLSAISRLLASYLPDPVPRQAALGAGLLMLPLALNHLCLGAFHILMVWLMVAGLARAAEGRSWSGGLMLGLAVWLKLLPLLGVAYLVLKRRWLAAVVAVAAAVIVDMALTLPVFGPQRTWELHVQWWHTNVTDGTTHRALTEPGHIDEDRATNQSVVIVLRRLLTHMDWVAEPCPARRQVALADLAPDQLRLAYLGMIAVIGLPVLFYWRRPGRSLAPSRWAVEIALVAMATLWFSPVAWSYHPTAATPALAVILARRAVQPGLTWTAVALWLAKLATFGWPLARAFGATLWITLGLGVILVWPAPATRRDEERLPKS